MDEVDLGLNPDGWKEWSVFVLKELGRLSKAIEKIQTDVTALREDMILVRFKLYLVAALAGLIAGGVTSLVVAFLFSLTQ